MMNPAIPLSAQPVDVIGALTQSTQAAGMANQVRRTNALNDLYQAQGPGIMAGDQNALNALAQLDPMAGLGVQQARQSMAYDTERLNMARAEAARSAERHTATMNAEQRATALQQLQQQFTPAAIAARQGDEAAWNRAMQAIGQDTPFSDAPLLLAQAFGLSDALEMVPNNQFNPDAYRVVGDTLVDLSADGGPAAVDLGQAQAPTAGFDTVMDLRKEVNANPVIRNFTEISTAYNRIQSSATTAPSAAGDIALIFGFMKMLDPTSVVREGEFATAQNSAGVEDSIRNMYNRVLNGERLQPAQRQDFLGQAQAIYSGQQDQYKRAMNDYRGIAERYGVPFEDIFIRSAVAEPASGSDATPPAQSGTAPNAAPDFSQMTPADLARVDLSTLDNAGLQAYLDAVSGGQ